MARKKTQHALHIKSHTHGSSNEISFSVLDAAREARDAEERDRRRGGETGKISLFTLGSSKKPRSTPTKGQHIVIPEGAAPAHKADRPSSPALGRRAESRIPGVITVVVIVCALLALALTVSQTFLQVNARQTSFRGQLLAQIDVVNQCDQTLIPFDNLVMAQYEKDRFSRGDTPSFDELSDSYRAVVGDIAPSRSQLEEAITALEALVPSLSENKDKEAAHQAISAARSRLNMLDSGVAVIDESLMATAAFSQTQEGWKKLIDADAAAREATSLLRDMTKENVEKSMERSSQAADLLVQAASLFSQAQEGYPALDLQDFINYAAKREESQRTALEADRAYLDRDKEQLKKKNKQYNQLEEEAAALAEQMGDDPAARVVDLYRSAIEEDVQAYDAERVKAGNADAFLRDYLGSVSE
ncbi:hypothetical protein AALA69_01385 [Eggerthellaceae bacterium 24-137]